MLKLNKFSPVSLSLSLSLSLLLVSFPLLFAAEESITITTYYPAPYGSYNDLYVANSLGIGTTAPIEKLQVVGTGRFITSNTGVNYLLKIGGSTHLAGNAYGITFDPEGQADGYVNRNKIAIVAEGDGSGWSRGKLHILQNNVADANPATLSNAVVTILPSGNVGIGTTGPDAMLTLGANAGSHGYIRFRGPTIAEGNIYHDATYGLHLDTSSNLLPIKIDGSALILGMTGNVGIGTTGPGAKLHVEGSVIIPGFETAADVLSFRSGIPDGTNVGVRAKAITTANRDGLELLGYNGIDFSINNGATVAMHINGQGATGPGNVGIGTTNPGAKLHIYGDNALLFGPNTQYGAYLVVAGSSQAMLGTTYATYGVSNGNIHIDSAEGAYGVYTQWYGGTGGTHIGNGAGAYGALTKGSGTFNIPHPVPAKAKAGWRLQHSFVESPTRGDNLYRWQVSVKNGQADIDLPEYFRYLNENVQVWISPVKHFGRAYAEVSEDMTKIYVKAEEDGSYNVLAVGTRKDKTAKENFDKLGVEYKNKNPRIKN